MTAKDPPAPIHLALRFSDRLFRVGNVVQRHQDVIETFGAVWFGKIGQPIGRETASLLRRSAANGDGGSCLFLVQRYQSGTDLFRSCILDVATDGAPEEQILVPTYYEELGLTTHMRSWLKIGAIEKAPVVTLDRLTVVSSGRTLRNALRTSMAGAFVVEDDKGAA